MWQSAVTYLQDLKAPLGVWANDADLLIKPPCNMEDQLRVRHTLPPLLRITQARQLSKNEGMDRGVYKL